MIRPVKNYEYVCDRCGKKETGTTRPPGWTVYRSGGWGMTNYVRDEDLCATCSEIQKRTR